MFFVLNSIFVHSGCKGTNKWAKKQIYLYFSERKYFRRKSKVVQKNERWKIIDEKNTKEKRTGILRVFGPLFRWLLRNCTILLDWCNTLYRLHSSAIFLITFSFSFPFFNCLLSLIFSVIWKSLFPVWRCKGTTNRTIIQGNPRF